MLLEDDDIERERRPARRRYEEPIASRLRREIVAIAENVMGPYEDQCAGIGREIGLNFEDDQIRGPFLDNLVQLLKEQPMKIPFVAAVILYANDVNSEAGKETMARVGAQLQNALEKGDWREFKLLLRFFGCLQGILQEGGVLPVLDELFDLAADQMAASEEDAVGLELVKIILLTIPYIMASSATGLEEQISELLKKTEVIAYVQHPHEVLVAPYPGDGPEIPFGFQSVIGLLQKQLEREAEKGWELRCIARPYKFLPELVPEPKEGEVKEENGTNGDAKPKTSTKHPLPAVTIPAPQNLAQKPLFPETFFSIYADLEVETVPPTTNIAASLMRDCLIDNINILDFNRTATAKFLIEMDFFWARGTFASRGVTLDQLKNYPAERSHWKPEDVVLDALFSQIFLLPRSEHKLIYYHSVITETCKLAPSQIAPTLGRAIRFLFKHIDVMDMELAYRYLDWFAHHLSNFEFRWKWSEWVGDLDRVELHPKKAFIMSILDKEIRLSFAKRIRETVPHQYHFLITEGKFKDVPEFKYNSPTTPYSSEGKEILSLLRKKAPESEIQIAMDAIQTQAAEHGIEDPMIPSTDAYVTAVCFIGSKSLSHVLSCIERCKERLLNIGPMSEGARRQIVASVVEYWKDQPGTAVNIIDKLLNYTIVTPESVIIWALGPETLGNGSVLAEGWRYEMVSVTVGKVTNRVRQIVAARVSSVTASLEDEQIKMLDDTLTKERAAMRQLFAAIADAVGGIAAGAADGFIEEDNFTTEEAALVKQWGERWGRVFNRKLAVEEAFVGEAAVVAQIAGAIAQAGLQKTRDEKAAVLKAEEDAKREVERLEAEAKAAAEVEEKQAIGLNGHGVDGNGAMDMEHDVVE
ncbi:cap binding protein [Tothia fuscella]|uniref:Cap binding protein n=1 Tax=Tothia fuscella TaxID=1048955 RepID=A0A9P4NF57_9PEZI|nr:cap binding protein [Tothia fuscella]